MKLENQVCSLEQAKKLRELGVIFPALDFTPRLALYTWFNVSLGPVMDNSVLLPSNQYPPREGSYYAWTVAELGVMLPDEITTQMPGIRGTRLGAGRYPLKLLLYKFDFESGRFGIAYRFDNNINMQMPIGNPFTSSSEAEARATMLIYLLENNLITADEVNKRLQAV